MQTLTPLQKARLMGLRTKTMRHHQQELPETDWKIQTRRLQDSNQPLKNQPIPKDSPEILARRIERAFLYGHAEDMENWLDEVTPESYFFLHPQVRLYLQIEFYKTLMGAHLRKLLLVSLERALLNEEKTLAYGEMSKDKDAIFLWSYWELHSQDILLGSQGLPSELGLHEDFLYFLSGKQALILGKIDEGKECFEKINQATGDYEEAFSLLWEAYAQKGKHTYQDLLWQEPHWRKRLDMIRGWLEEFPWEKPHEAREHGLMLGSVLKEPWKFVPQTSEAWFLLSKELISWIEKKGDMFPPLIGSFQWKARQEGGIWEEAWWAPWLHIKNPSSPWGRYFQAIAKLRAFLSMPSSHPSYFWEARQILMGPLQNSMESWEVFHAWCLKKIKNIPLWDSLKFVIKAASSPDFFTVADLEKIFPWNEEKNEDGKEGIAFYLPQSFLEEVKNFAKAHGASKLTWQVFCCQKRAFYSNEELFEFGSLSANQEQWDSSWRCASILKFRQALPSGLQASWSVSSENKKHYPILSREVFVLSYCWQDMAHDKKLWFQSLQSLGASLPDFFSLSNTQIFPKAPWRPEAKALIDEAKKISWLSQAKGYALLQEGPSWPHRPLFAKKEAHSPWGWWLSILTHLLSPNLWEFNPKTLAFLCQSSGRELTSQSRKDFQKGFQNWWKRRTATEQKAWNIILSPPKNLLTEDVQLFFLKMSICLWPHHVEALEALNRMEIPLSLLRKFEVWLLSSVYGEMRFLSRQASRIPVPLGLWECQREKESRE